ncbi:hypothetical protein HK105_206778 [Polyrhizophydium stewartii]|uniref:Uncharacterized protein n=1 Tax=Polyrhizophydium stewartii TaxID=2732419 RepID=A0ABR4N2N1_9FUNG
MRVLAATALLAGAVAAQGAGTFLLSNNGQWPAGTTQTVTITANQAFSKKMYLESMTLSAGTSSTTICSKVFAASGSSVACTFTVPTTLAAGTAGSVVASWQDCTNLLGPVLCSNPGTAVGAGITIQPNPSATTSAASSTTDAATSTSSSSSSSTTSASRTARSSSASGTSSSSDSPTPTSTAAADGASSGSSSNTALIIGGVIVAIVLLMGAGFGIWYWQRRVSSNDSLLPLKEEMYGPAPLKPVDAAGIKAAASAAASATGINGKPSTDKISAAGPSSATPLNGAPSAAASVVSQQPYPPSAVGMGAVPPVPYMPGPAPGQYYPPPQPGMYDPNMPQPGMYDPSLGQPAMYDPQFAPPAGYAPTTPQGAYDPQAYQHQGFQQYAPGPYAQGQPAPQAQYHHPQQPHGY